MKKLLIAFFATLALVFAGNTATASAYWHVGAAEDACEAWSYASNDATMRLYGLRASHVYWDGPASQTVPSDPNVTYTRISASRVVTTIWRLNTTGIMKIYATCDTSGTSWSDSGADGTYDPNYSVYSYGQSAPFWV